MKEEESVNVLCACVRVHRFLKRGKKTVCMRVYMCVSRFCTIVCLQ